MAILAFFMGTAEHINKRNILEDWVAEYSDDLYRWALQNTGSKEIAEDLIQDTFLAAYKSIDRFQGKSKPKTWLIAILNNKITDYHRKKFRETASLGSETDSKGTGTDVLDQIFNEDGSWNPARTPHAWTEQDEHLLDNEAFNVALQYCMEQLPQHWSLAIRLKYMSAKSGKEICQELGITPTNFWQILHRTKLQLRGCLETNWFKHS